MTPDTSSSQPLARIARYRVIDRLGAGGMGEVYRARDEQLDRDVAVKVLPSTSFDDPAARVRLVREARAAAALNHPNVCVVHEVGESDGQAYIAMELVEGATLSEALAGGALTVERVVEYGRQLADALAHAHDRGVVHRDLKSNNVMVTPDGRVKVLDFGLAKRSIDADVTAALTRMQSLTQPGVAVGTLPYMAPEQLRGASAGVSSDIWALGVVLHEMAAGTRPFGGQTPFELSAAILNDAPPPLPQHVPQPLRAVIERCLAKDPNERCSSAVDVRGALERIQRAPSSSLESTPRAAVSTGTSKPVLHVAVTRRQALWLGCAGVLGAAGLAAWQLRPATATAVRTLAVLTLENTAKDEDLEYLCEGIAGSLITQISKLPSFKVSSLTSVLEIRKRSVVDPQIAGRLLRVDTVLAGTLELREDGLHIETRLIDVASGKQLWKGGYDRNLTELLAVQDEIAGAIMADEVLNVQLTTTERSRLVRHPTTDGDAFDLYLQAGYVQRRATEEGYLQARTLLERAISRDKKFAMAYASLSGTIGMMVTDGLLQPNEAWSLVNTNMRQAREFEPDLPEAIAHEHGMAFFSDWDWPGAERARLKLLELPSGEIEPDWLRPLAIERWALGRTDEALQLARRARERDPGSPYLAVLEADYLLRDGQLDAAVALYERAAKEDPENHNSLFGLAEARFRQGRFDEALEVRRKAHALAKDKELEPLFASARGEKGYRQIDEQWVRLQLEVLKKQEATRYVSPLDFARAYAQLGERDMAFTYIEAAFKDRSPGLVFLKVDPAWDKVRGDKRFGEAVRRVGLP